MYETFAHTADLGLRVRAPDLPSLFAEAGRGLTSIIAENIQDIRESVDETIVIDGTEMDDLLFDWLNELLFLWESQRKLFSRFHVRLTEQGLTATACGEQWNAIRHPIAREVKAITYHQFKLEQTAAGWLAEVILDI